MEMNGNEKENEKRKPGLQVAEIFEFFVCAETLRNAKIPFNAVPLARWIS